MEISHDVPLKNLKPHPLNAEIYGEPDKKLVEDIEKNGLLTPIVINSKNIIISGHRRLKAMMVLGFTATDVIIRDFQDELDEQEKLIAYNQQREKTSSQMFAEAEKLKEIVVKRAKRRQAHGQTAPGRTLVDPGTLSDSNKKGKSRDKLAEEVGFKGKGRTLERGLQIYKAAKEGNEQAKESLKKIDGKESGIKTEYEKLFKKEAEEKQQQPTPQPKLKVVKGEPKPKEKEFKLISDPDFTDQQLKDALWMERVYKEVDALWCEMFRRNDEMVRAWAMHWRKYGRMEHCLGFPERLTNLLEMFRETLQPTIEVLKVEFEKEMLEYNAKFEKK